MLGTYKGVRVVGREGSSNEEGYRDWKVVVDCMIAKKWNYGDDNMPQMVAHSSLLGWRMGDNRWTVETGIRDETMLGMILK